MWSFSTFKDKRYWILLIPAIIILFLFAVFTPDYILEETYGWSFLILIFLVLFWSTYHLWKYFGDKKKRHSTDDGCDL
ncbi:permease [Lysinibacillus sp. SGAir0095]|nr:permease [Lysinibacillus sp. SGAir0095]